MAQETTQPKTGSIEYLDDLLKTLERHVNTADRNYKPLSNDVSTDLVIHIQELAAKLPLVPKLDENTDLLYVFSNLVMVARDNPEMTEV